MLYDYQYTIIAIISMLALFALVYYRKSYSTGSNRVFLSLMYANLLGSVFDFITFYTISFPERYSMYINYISNMLYLFTFAILPVTYARYIINLLREEKLIKPIGWFSLIMGVIEAVLIFTTHITHFIFYLTLYNRVVN
ncbi:MAG: hypothetical protein Q4D13_07650 [Erysipelotrichaceae bacterium]|nr:hypothetical protein [Erysipelotrichaceae bacterium]